MKFEYYSNVKEGQLQTNVRKQIAKDLSFFEKKRVKIVIEKLSAKRSNAQNSYLHALFTMYSIAMIDYTGDRDYTPAFIKNICKTEYLTKDKINEGTGEVIGKYVKDTSTLSKEEMSTFYDQIIQGAAEKHNIILMYPNEKGMLDFEE